MLSFDTIRARAAERKGGEAALARLLPKPATPKQLAALRDDRVLAEMTRRIFCSGFAWTVIDKKWPGFEAAFLGFDPPRLLRQTPDFWDALTADTRIVRNGQKIMSVAANAHFITDIAAEHGSFGSFLAGWPATDQIGLLALLTLFPLLGRSYFKQLSPSGTWKHTYQVKAAILPGASGFAGQLTTWNCTYTLHGKGPIANAGGTILIESTGRLDQQGGRFFEATSKMRIAYDPAAKIPVVVRDVRTHVPQRSVYSNDLVELKLTKDSQSKH